MYSFAGVTLCFLYVIGPLSLGRARWVRRRRGKGFSTLQKYNNTVIWYTSIV